MYASCVATSVEILERIKRFKGLASFILVNIFALVADAKREKDNQESFYKGTLRELKVSFSKSRGFNGQKHVQRRESMHE